MSDLNATVATTPSGFHITGTETITYTFTFQDSIFSPSVPHLAKIYTPFSRCLLIADATIIELYGPQIFSYFSKHGIALTVHETRIGEKAKTMETMLGICDAMTRFGVMRKEPVLVVGGGLVTDVAGFACAAYRRTTPYIRIPTTLIGLIDASVSIKVGVNHGAHKNRLGAYHAPSHTFLDFTFLRTLPEAQMRNGFAELIKISTCADLRVFELLEQHCEDLIRQKFGRAEEAREELRQAADEVNRRGIEKMLQLETPNLHEIMLDRVIAFGHTWSPTLELAPKVPLRHGHAISVDMAFSTTLALVKGMMGVEEHQRILKLFSRAGLSMDHPLLTEDLLKQGTEAILKTRDGKLRAAMPVPLGGCTFLNDVTEEEMGEALRKHKEVCRTFPRNGEGIDAYVDASDTGEEMAQMAGKVGEKASGIMDKIGKMGGQLLGARQTVENLPN